MARKAKRMNRQSMRRSVLNEAKAGQTPADNGAGNRILIHQTKAQQAVSKQSMVGSLN